MTIKTTASEISVQNASGINKFSSNDKLMYRKNYFSGSLSLGPSTPRVLVPLYGAVSDSNTFFLVQAKITSCNGNIGTGFIGSTFDLSGAVLLHFTYSTTEVMLTAQDVLSAHVRRSPDVNNMAASFDYRNMTNGSQRHFAEVTEPATSVSLDYFISVFGWK